MKKVFIINAHTYYPFSEGKLNTTLTEKITDVLKNKGHEIKTTILDNGYDVAEELSKHLWANVVILQTPVNWMGVTWKFKKYMDEVYSSGMDGSLCNNDGRDIKSPKKNYGGGGCLVNTQYMLSLTLNAPEEAFNDENEYLFQGKTIDDLFFPQHMNFRFFGMKALPTFSTFDVIKNPEIKKELIRLEQHLETHI